eukprot:366956-Rhodomonas_salina.1
MDASVGVRLLYHEDGVGELGACLLEEEHRCFSADSLRAEDERFVRACKPLFGREPKDAVVGWERGQSWCHCWGRVE